jgi:hypothetical protein
LTTFNNRAPSITVSNAVISVVGSK